MDDSGVLPVEGCQKDIYNTEDDCETSDDEDVVGSGFHRTNNLLGITGKDKNKNQISFDSTKPVRSPETFP